MNWKVESIFNYFLDPLSMVNKFEKILATVKDLAQSRTIITSFTKFFRLSKSIHYIENERNLFNIYCEIKNV